MLRGIVFVLASALVPAAAHGGGLLVGEPGSQAMERGGAFVAKADDPTALWINPAGLTRGTGVSVYVGSNFLDYSLTVDRSGQYEPTQEEDPEPAYVGQELPAQTDRSAIQPIPGLAAALVIDRGSPTFGKFAFALGVFGPQGFPNRDFECGEDDCPIDADGRPSPVRYDVVSQKALIVLPSLAAAVEITPRIAVGVRASWGFGNIQARSFTWGIRNRNEYIQKDGDFRVDVSDSFIPAFGIGVQARPMDNLEIGLAYASAVKFRGEGTGVAILGDQLGVGEEQDHIAALPAGLMCAPGGTDAALAACLDTDIPQTVAAGVRWVFRDGARRERGDIEADFKWENWSAASDIAVRVDGESFLTGIDLNEVFIRHGFEDVFSARLGGSFRMSFPLELRAGVAYDTAAAPVTWTRADMDGKQRVTVALGAAYAFGGGKYRLDLGIGAVIEPDVEVDPFPDPAMDQPQAERTRPDPVQPLTGPNNQTQSPFNSGTYESGYLLGMFGFTGSF